MYVGAFLELEYENQHPVEYEHLIRCYVARTKKKRQQSLTFNFFYITDEQMEKPYPAEKQMQSSEK